jgi:CheY-like chemotaxis protein
VSLSRNTLPVLAERPGPLAVDHHACCALRIDRRLGTPRGPFQEAALPLAVSRFAAPRDINMGSASLAGCSILICEDEPLIALGIADAFTNAGARVLTVGSLARALIAIEDEVPSAVILDHALSDGESSQLCERLKERNIPYVNHSGYSKHNGACSDAVHVPKPANPDVLVTTVLGLLQRRRPTLHLNL